MANSRPRRDTAADTTPAPSSTSAVLDLDVLEREGGSPAPFDFVLKGRRYILSDPKEIDWKKLVAAMTNPYLFFKLTLPPDDQEAFFATDLATWKLNVLMERYQQHYGIPTAGEVAALPR